MQTAEVFLPEDVSREKLQALYDDHGLQTHVDNDGDLVVTSQVSCYVLPGRTGERIVLLTFIGIKKEIDRQQKTEFVGRVNNEIAAVRARVNQKEAVVFDYHLPVEGGISGQAIVAATQFFLMATAHAIDLCDKGDIVR